jgi:hypothetical protein
MQTLSFQSEIFIKMDTRLVGWTPVPFRGTERQWNYRQSLRTQHSPRCDYAGIDGVP